MTHDNECLQPELAVIIQPNEDSSVFLEVREEDVDGLGRVQDGISVTGRISELTWTITFRPLILLDSNF